MRVVVAKKPFKGNLIGSEIEVASRDARVLFALGRAVRAGDAVVAEVVEVEPEEKPQKRAYRRRDMTAEG